MVLPSELNQYDDDNNNNYQWLWDRLHTLQARQLVANCPNMPRSFVERLQALDIDEPTGPDCEPLIIAVIRHIHVESDRIKYLKLLLDAGADVNGRDLRDQRTALIYSAIENDCVDVGRMLLGSPNIRIDCADRLGNTALMYCAMRGRDQLMHEMISKMARDWSLATIQLKNCMGLSAEELAIRNGHHRCARMVQSQRLHMLSCLNRQLDMFGIGCRHWRAFTSVFKCIEKWKPKQRRRSAEISRNHRLSGTNANGRKKSL